MPNRLPRVSVLMPVRDAGEYLYETIRSLVSQSFEDFEVVAVDDGSSDDSADQLASWAAGDARVRLFRRPTEGLVAALQYSRAQARAPLLARMDADDIAAPERFARQIEMLDGQSALAGCGSHVKYFPEAGVRKGARRYEAWLNGMSTPETVERSIFVECPIAHPTLMLRATAFDAVGGYRDQGWPEDYDLVLRLWAGGHPLAVVPEVLHRWREHADRASRTDPRYGPDAFRACKLEHLSRTLLLSGRPVVVWGAGPVGKGWARALQRRGRRIAAFVDLDPRKIGQEIHGAPVLSGAGWPVKGLDELSREAEDTPLHLAAVGQPGARRRIESLLESAGLEPLRDFVSVA